MIGAAWTAFSTLSSPVKIGAYVAGGGVLLVGLLWAKGMYDGHIEWNHSVDIAEQIEGASAGTLVEDIKREAAEKKEALEALAKAREKSESAIARSDAALAAVAEASRETARAARASRLEHEQRRAEVPAAVAGIADADLVAELREELRLHRVMDGTEPR